MVTNLTDPFAESNGKLVGRSDPCPLGLSLAGGTPWHTISDKQFKFGVLEKGMHVRKLLF